MYYLTTSVYGSDGPFGGWTSSPTKEEQAGEELMYYKMLDANTYASGYLTTWYPNTRIPIAL